MPKKLRDPFLKVHDYFATAPIDAAKLALTLVADTVQKRLVETGQVPPSKVRKRSTRRPPVAAAPDRTEAQES
jgi:hypothetical protein